MSKRTKKSHYLATISLLMMGIGFVATIPLQRSFWGALLQGGFEAGLVGGLADWFAVTALFRHPLGVPIPHTALLPKNRNRITAAIISMLENDWLTKESIRRKITDIQFTDKLFTIAEKEINSPSVQKNIVAILHQFIHSIDLHRMAPWIEKEVKSRISQLDLKNYLPSFIDQLIKRKYDEKALDYILREIEEWSKKDRTKDRLGRMAVEAIENIKADGFMQFALKSFSNLVNEDKLGNIIQNLILKGVNSFQDPFNPNRQTLLFHIHSKLENLKTDEKLYNELNALKTQLIAKWEPKEQIIHILNEWKQIGLTFINEPGFFKEYGQPLIDKGLESLKTDPEKVDALETWIKKQISDFIENNHSKIGKLVKENLDKLDEDTLIAMVETNVGKDLQWIRVNGAVCGFFIGLILVGLRSVF